MNIGSARLGLAASAAIALIAGAATMPASAQSTTYPVGTDCTKLVGNSKTECANQAKMTGSAPDNSNNPSMSPDDDSGVSSSTSSTITNSPSATGTTTTTSQPQSDYYPTNSKDCAKLVGNSKTECAHNAKNGPSPDNSNNPDQQN